MTRAPCISTDIPLYRCLAVLHYAFIGMVTAGLLLVAGAPGWVCFIADHFSTAFAGAFNLCEPTVLFRLRELKTWEYEK